MKSVLKKQVGGDHYKNMPMQLVELFARTNCNAFQGNMWKYIVRYKHKNGAEDIRKCIHYAQLARELGAVNVMTIQELDWVFHFCKVNNIDGKIYKIMKDVAYNLYPRVIRGCNEILRKEYKVKQ